MPIGRLLRGEHMLSFRSWGTLVGFICCSLMAAGQIPTGDRARFVSSDKTYEVTYPKNWRALGQPETVLNIVNFPEREQIRGVIIPEGGAQITAMQAPNGVRSVQQWAQNDRKFSKEAVMAPTEVAVPAKLKPRGKVANRIFESKWRSSIGPGAELEEIAFYVVADSRLFRVQLTYGPENTDSARLRSIALEMAASIKALPADAHSR